MDEDFPQGPPQGPPQAPPPLVEREYHAPRLVRLVRPNVDAEDDVRLALFANGRLYDVFSNSTLLPQVLARLLDTDLVLSGLAEPAVHAVLGPAANQQVAISIPGDDNQLAAAQRTADRISVADAEQLILQHRMTTEVTEFDESDKPGEIRLMYTGTSTPTSRQLFYFAVRLDAGNRMGWNAANVASIFCVTSTVERFCELFHLDLPVLHYGAHYAYDGEIPDVGYYATTPAIEPDYVSFCAYVTAPICAEEVYGAGGAPADEAAVIAIESLNYTDYPHFIGSAPIIPYGGALIAGGGGAGGGGAVVFSAAALSAVKRQIFRAMDLGHSRWGRFTSESEFRNAMLQCLAAEGFFCRMESPPASGSNHRIDIIIVDTFRNYAGPYTADMGPIILELKVGVGATLQGRDRANAVDQTVRYVAERDAFLVQSTRQGSARLVACAAVVYAPRVVPGALSGRRNDVRVDWVYTAPRFA